MRIPDKATHRRLPFHFFVFFYLLTALFTFRDYGITWDEFDWYISGEEYLKHFLHMLTPEIDQKEIFSIEQASHNYLYPALARVFSHSMQAPHLHLFNLIFALVVFWALYEVLLDGLGNRWWALLGPVTLYSAFRFSGDIPANPKDMPLAVMYSVSLSVFYFYRRNKWNGYLWDFIVGSLIGLTADIRILGITLLAVFLAMRFWDRHFDRENGVKERFGLWLAQEIPHWLLVFLVSQFWMMALWPYLGSNYLGNLLNIFRASKDFSWPGPMMFMGSPIYSAQKLWYYLPVWMLISMPLFVVLFLFYSFVAFFKTKEKGPRRFCFIFTFALVLNLSLYFILKPVIYNALRHYLFLVPIVCILSVFGLFEFWTSLKSVRLKKITLLFVGINFLTLGWQFFRLYPYQYIYMNELVGWVQKGGHRFDCDYWGASLKEASQWLVTHELTDPKRLYAVQTCGVPWQETYYFPANVVGNGPKEVKDPDYRIEMHYEDPARPDDFVLTPEWKKRIVYTVEREGIPLAYVFKLK